MNMDVKIQRSIKYDDDLARDICWKIAISPCELNTLFENNKHWPNKNTLRQWLRENSEFAELFILAHDIRENHLKEER